MGAIRGELAFLSCGIFPMNIACLSIFLCVSFDFFHQYFVIFNMQLPCVLCSLYTSVFVKQLIISFVWVFLHLGVCILLLVYGKVCVCECVCDNWWSLPSLLTVHVLLLFRSFHLVCRGRGIFYMAKRVLCKQSYFIPSVWIWMSFCLLVFSFSCLSLSVGQTGNLLTPFLNLGRKRWILPS